jgi:hypothetical protein
LLPPNKKSGELTMATAAQVNANQVNAQKSTGPTTEAGKAKSSANAVKTGLTGRIIMMSGEDCRRLRKARQTLLHQVRAC